MNAPIEWSVALMCSAFILLFIFGYNAIKREQGLHLMVPITAIACGVILMLSIFLNVHRLWGFYLFPGMILFVSGLIGVVEGQLFLSSKEGGLLSTKLNGLGKFIAITTLITLMSYTFYWWPPSSYYKYIGYANRTENKVFKDKYESYKMVTQFLSEYSKLKDKKLLVAYSPSLFPPESNGDYRIIEFWGPYSNWDLERDVIVFNDDHSLDHKPTSVGSANYDRYLLEREGYNNHVINKGEDCIKDRCYERVMVLPRNGEILVLTKSAN